MVYGMPPIFSHLGKWWTGMYWIKERLISLSLSPLRFLLYWKPMLQFIKSKTFSTFDSLECKQVWVLFM